jgi:hypothetical protein
MFYVYFTLKMHACEVCNQVFTLKHNLTRHVKSTHDVIKFTCNVCLKSFTRQFNLDQHAKTAHRRSVIQYTPQAITGNPLAVTKPVSSPTDNHTVNLCDDVLGDIELMEFVNNIQHTTPESMEPVSTPTDGHMVDLCDNVSGDDDLLGIISNIQYSPPESLKPANTSTNEYVVNNIWDTPIGFNQLVEIMNEFENPGKK